MLKVDMANMMSDAIGSEHGVSKKDLEYASEMAKSAHEKFQKWRESGDAIFFDYASESAPLEGIAEAADAAAKDWDDLIVLGIGGSALGLKCFARALLHPFWNALKKNARNRPRLFVCDNVDPATFGAVWDIVDVERTGVVVISKSGGTAETAAQFMLSMDIMKKNLGDGWRKNVAVITDPKKGSLRPLANSEKLLSFPIPPKLGGRFSAMSPVGLFPSACLGIDVKEIIRGARDMAKMCSSPNPNENQAYKIGMYQWILDSKKGKHISVMMPYADSLSLVSDWYAQLWAESLGKNGGGQTPVKALGATDQHSQVQLYMDGPNDKAFTFLRVDGYSESRGDMRVKANEGTFSYMDGRTLGEILNAEQTATADALTSGERPNMTITMPEVDEYHMGALFMLFETATAFAGALYGINPFDQPGVEEGKRLTKRILSGYDGSSKSKI